MTYLLALNTVSGLAGTAVGKVRHGVIVVMDFSAQQLEPLLKYTPLSWNSENLMAAISHLLCHIDLPPSPVRGHLIHGPLYLTRNSEEVVLMQFILRPQTIFEISLLCYPFRIPFILSDRLSTLVVVHLSTGVTQTFIPGRSVSLVNRPSERGCFTCIYKSIHSYHGACEY